MPPVAADGSGRPGASRRPTQSLAEQSRGPEDEDHDEDPEGDDLLQPDRVARNEVDRKRLGHAQHEAPEHRAADVADSAEDSGGEGIERWDEPHVRGHLGDHRIEEACGATEYAAEGEGRGDGPVNVDAHEARRLGVLRDGADAPPHLGAINGEVEPDEHDDRSDHHDDVVGGNHRSEGPSDDVVVEGQWKRCRIAAELLADEVDEEVRGADGRDQVGQWRGVAPTQWSVGEAFEEDGHDAADRP